MSNKHISVEQGQKLTSLIAENEARLRGADKTEVMTEVNKKADSATSLAGYGITDAYTKTEADDAVDAAKTEVMTEVDKKADSATSLAGYGIADAYTKTEADDAVDAAKTEVMTEVDKKADSATSLAGYGIADAYTKTEADDAVDAAKTEVMTEVNKKADSATSLAGYGIADAYTKTEADDAVDAAKTEVMTEVNKKAAIATTLAGYGIGDAYTKSEADTAISTAIANSSHLKKALSTQAEVEAFIANPTTADKDTIYLVKDETVTGSDKYFEYTLIGEEFVCTGDTTTSLAGFVKEEDIVFATNDDIDNIIKAVYGEQPSAE